MELKFTLNSMYGLDTELAEELSKLNLKTIDDVSKSSFSAVNKNNVVELAKALATILGRSQELLKCAATDLDVLKCGQLQNQSKLLSVQDELIAKKSDQLEAVTTTVEEKLCSWTDVVKKNTTQSLSSSNQKKMKQVIQSAIKDSDREGNVMMFNVPEEVEERGLSTLDHDHGLVQRIMGSSGFLTPCDMFCERIGTPAQGKRRPLRVRIGNESAVFYLLSCSKNLRQTEFSASQTEAGRSGSYTRKEETDSGAAITGI